jgi:hypothetical protein
MKGPTASLVVFAALLMASGCSSTQEPPPAEEPEVTEPAPAATREIALTKGDTLSVGVDVEGNVEIVVTIQEGKPGAGRYVSDEKGLAEAARDALSVLPEQDVSITVDDAGRILTISASATGR